MESLEIKSEWYVVKVDFFGYALDNNMFGCFYNLKGQLHGNKNYYLCIFLENWKHIVWYKQMHYLYGATVMKSVAEHIFVHVRNDLFLIAIFAHS